MVQTLLRYLDDMLRPLVRIAIYLAVVSILMVPPSFAFSSRGNTLSAPKDAGSRVWIVAADDSRGGEVVMLVNGVPYTYRDVTLYARYIIGDAGGGDNDALAHRDEMALDASTSSSTR